MPLLTRFVQLIRILFKRIKHARVVNLPQPAREGEPMKETDTTEPVKYFCRACLEIRTDKAALENLEERCKEKVPGGHHIVDTMSYYVDLPLFYCSFCEKEWTPDEFRKARSKGEGGCSRDRDHHHWAYRN